MLTHGGSESAPPAQNQAIAAGWGRRFRLPDLSDSYVTWAIAPFRVRTVPGSDCGVRT